MKKKEVIIIKASGKQDVFKIEKLKNSLERSGANEAVIQKIVKEVNDTLYDGISTKEIYQKAFAFLKKASRPTAARYKLKKAIQELGPTGYPFEKFVGEILRFQGYETQVGVIVQGHCVKHEVDVVAVKDEVQIMLECKFHSDSGRFCDVKIPLYIQSRFVDIVKEWNKLPDHELKDFQGWIATNTRFTTDAIQYGTCVGLKLLGWDYPKEGSLKERIDISGLHPITCLTTLTKREKEDLLANNIVLCADIIKRPETLTSVGIKEGRRKKIVKETMELCSSY